MNEYTWICIQNMKVPATQTHTYAHKMHTRTHLRTCTRTHTLCLSVFLPHTHRRTHTHTHAQTLKKKKGGGGHWQMAKITQNSWITLGKWKQLQSVNSETVNHDAVRLIPTNMNIVVISADKIYNMNLHCLTKTHWPVHKYAEEFTYKPTFSFFFLFFCVAVQKQTTDSCSLKGAFENGECAKG